MSLILAHFESSSPSYGPFFPHSPRGVGGGVDPFLPESPPPPSHDWAAVPHDHVYMPPTLQGVESKRWASIVRAFMENS